MKKLFLGLMGCLLALGAFAGEEMLQLPTRPGVTVPVFYMKQAGATATIILLPGGAGGIGRTRGGQPTGMNFLVRAREHFARAGLNVALMDRPSDISDLDAATRVSPPHLQDIQAVVSHLKADTGLPVWLASVPAILAGLTNTATKKLVMMQGGDAPRGDPCEAMHYHGFIGIEKEAAQVITDWIRNPRS